MRLSILKILFVTTVLSLLFSCNGTKFVAENELLLIRNTIASTDPGIDVRHLSQHLAQQPNSKWFSTLKVPLGIYSMAGKDSTKFYNRWLHKWGEAPVILDTIKLEQSSRNLVTAMQNDGYLDAEVFVDKTVSKRRVKVHYSVTPNRFYTIRNVSYAVSDSRVDSILRADNILFSKELSAGERFRVNTLNDERKRITSWLNEHGYLYFNKEAVSFYVDSCKEKNFVDVTMNIGLYRRSSAEEWRNHPFYVIRNVEYQPTYGQKLKLRRRILDISTSLRNGDLYKASNVQKTYNKFSRLQTVKSTNIHLREVSDTTIGDARLLDAEIQITRKKPHSIRIEPEGTNTAGDFGAALAVTYENRNLFHGSEVFSLQARGAFEAIKGLDGYQRNNYTEFGVEGKISFPEFLIPFVSRDFLRKHTANSDFVVRYNWQNRPEFRRRVFTAGWNYSWQSSSGRNAYKLNLINVDYVSMPWISDTFKHDYLDNVSNRNAILRYNYEDLLVMKIGFGTTYTDEHNVLKLNVETAGNILRGLSSLFHASRNEDGQYKFARVAFAQYVKIDADYTHLFKFDYRNSLALHARIGVGVPYGNSTMLPYEKRYFSGGANSVRGWSVRELGPGRYRGTDGRIDFINQTGDIKLDLNAEFRTNLFWKFQGALFVDAGNVWTIRNYKDQPGGMLTLRNFYEGIAVAYGLGLRINVDYFILRLDLGMKAINPNYTTAAEHFPIIHPVFKRDYALHFAVGLPF
ncbi:MAG: BamA/TamA family outer membrane protein [Prevotella sp.]|nr:BamA/TamA family outer membrane protein [Candidatus Prevotella equi]